MIAPVKPLYTKPSLVNPARIGLGVLRFAARYPAVFVFLVIMAAAVFAALFAPWISPYDPIRGSLSARLRPPVWVTGGDPGHMLGTDTLGRDVLSRLIFGARISLSVSLLSILIAATLGCGLGLVSGYNGGWLDKVLMRVVDIFLSVPMILIAVIMAVLFGPSYTNVIVIIGLLTWPRWSRQIRGETLAIKQRDHVALAKASGCKPHVIMWTHILPNVMPTLLVLASLEFGYIIIVESSLSFLGVGVPPPAASWGGMVAETRGLLASAWWLPVVPGLAILLCVLAMNTIGDWIRDRLDPKLRQV